MASVSKCPHCGGVIRSDEKTCPHCGAENRNYSPDTPRTIYQPKTIAELKEYCAERGMPLLRMRFFIGEDYREPKAFGIYRDGKDVVVYKNKANGSRAVRYRGTDEAYAVNELFQKLLSECHNRGIYPDGEPLTRSGGSGSVSKQGPALNFFEIVLVLLGALCMLYLGYQVIHPILVRQSNGYYDYDSGKNLFYCSNGEWFYINDPSPEGKWRYLGEDWYWHTGSEQLTRSQLQLDFLGKEYQASWGFSSYSPDRDNRNLTGYYDLGDGALYYLRLTGKIRSNDWYPDHDLYYTSDPPPEGHWYWLSKYSNIDYGTIPLSDGSSAYQFHLQDAQLGRDYQEEWGFSPFSEDRVEQIREGYYDFGDGRLYHYDSEHLWRYTSSDSSSDWWHSAGGDSSVLSLGGDDYISPDAAENGYLGADWDSDWGGSEYTSPSGSGSSSWDDDNDWDDWDSDDTDWDSDW